MEGRMIPWLAQPNLHGQSTDLYYEFEIAQFARKKYAAGMIGC